MKRLTDFAILAGAVLLAGCVSPRPEDYGFQRVTLTGQERLCAPRDWVVPPVVPQDAAGDPLFPVYQQFLALPSVDIVSEAHAPTRDVCITQAQWPQWLMVRNRWNRDWAVTPGTAESLAAARAAGL